MDNSSKLKWTQEQAIAFECACEVITDMMAIRSGLIAEEKAKACPDAERILTLRTERSDLARERAALHVTDDATIARVRSEYGVVLRAWRAEHYQCG